MRVVKRWLVPLLIVIAWLTVSGIGGPYFGKLSDVQSSSNTDFLPASAESTRVAELRAAFDDEDAIPAILLFRSSEGFDREALIELGAQIEDVAALDGVLDASPPIPSERTTTDGLPEAVEAVVLIDGDGPETVDAIRDLLADTPEGVEHYVTGPAGFSADLVSAFGGIDGILLLVAIGAVFLILLLVYRSPILPILVLLSSVAALSAAVLAVYGMAAADWINLNGQTQGILFILVIGAATDYALLLVARYREALRHERSAPRALLTAWRGSLEPIVASAGTVVAGLLCLLFSDLNSNSALGPVASAGILFALVASLTFLPALLLLFGRVAFFPFAPRETDAERTGLWERVAGVVKRRPRLLWIVTSIVLIGLAALTPTFKAQGVPETDLLLGETESVTGQEILADYFPAGSGTPVIVLTAADGYEDVAAAIEDSPVVDSVAPRTAQEQGRPGADEPPVVVDIDGRPTVELQATLNVPADSEEALAAVRDLRERLPELDDRVLVGGDTATTVDTRDTANRDLVTIVPIVLAVILVILMLLLRSVVAPLILIATTAVSYLSTLGLSALVFNHAFGFPGADPVVPLFGFVFLVALGIDYNIFLTSRIREEALAHGTRPGILRGLTLTGGVITSAGVVLAATFAALAVIPLLFLVQLAFIVAVGVLIDTIVVRSILVPGLLYDIGSPIWWPSRLARRTED